MSSFEYLAILISVILGLAIARLTSNASKSIRRKSEFHTYWVQWVWTFNVWVFVLGIWWGMVAWDFLEEWSFFFFMFIMLYATLLFMLADALYPGDMNAGADLRSHFFEHRRWFFGLMILVVLMDIPETLLKETFGVRPVPPGYPFLVGSWLAMALTGFVTEKPGLHGAVAVAWPVITLGYLAYAIPVLWGGG